MGILFYYLKIYFRCSSQYIKARMQYRTDFIISCFGMAFASITPLIVFQVLFTTIPNLAGWTFDEIVFIYAFYLLSVVPLQFFFDNIWFLRYDIASGAFIKYYLKPLNIMFYFMSEKTDIKGFSQLILGLIALIYSSNRLGLHWSVGQLLVLVVALFSSSLVASSIMIIAGASGFWLIEGSLPVLNLASKIRDFAPFPTSIFDGFFRIVFTYIIPIGFIAFYPAQLFLKPNGAPLLAYLSPLMGLGSFMLAYTVWKKGVDSYAGTGS